MPTRFRFLPALAFVALLWTLQARAQAPETAPAPPPPPTWIPPQPPKHARRNLDSAGELAKDFAEVVQYLEHGQSYFRAYQRGTHTVEENQAFLKFLETYEKEYAIAKKEAATLLKWVEEKGSLDSAGR